MNLTLNIGLHSNLGGSIRPAHVLAEIQGLLGTVTNYSVRDSDTEPTLVVDVAATGDVKPRLFHLSRLLRQDCVAAWLPADREGLLTGPKAEDWGGTFNGEYFVQHNGVRLVRN